MSETELKDLVENGKTNKLYNFVSKTGKTFSASIKLKEDKKTTEFDFEY